jgi:hypothetical protein
MAKSGYPSGRDLTIPLERSAKIFFCISLDYTTEREEKFESQNLLRGFSFQGGGIKPDEKCPLRVCSRKVAQSKSFMVKSRRSPGFSSTA